MLKLGLQVNRDFKILNYEQWEYLSGEYGENTVLIRTSNDIYHDSMSDFLVE
jgi:hypothetical protein